MKTLKLLACAALIGMSTPAFADDVSNEHHNMHTSGHNMPQSDFDASMTEMHKMMSKVEASGNTDVDFVRGMIPHHQGAVEMAKVELAKGKDPVIRKLAADIIKAQEKEITMMKKWLSENATNKDKTN